MAGSSPPLQPEGAARSRTSRALRLFTRGVGGSTGSLAKATSEDLAEAVLAIAKNPAAARAKTAKAMELVNERHRVAVKVLKDNLPA